MDVNLLDSDSTLIYKFTAYYASQGQGYPEVPARYVYIEPDSYVVTDDQLVLPPEVVITNALNEMMTKVTNAYEFVKNNEDATTAQILSSLTEMFKIGVLEASYIYYRITGKWEAITEYLASFPSVTVKSKEDYDVGYSGWLQDIKIQQQEDLKIFQEIKNKQARLLALTPDYPISPLTVSKITVETNPLINGQTVKSIDQDSGVDIFNAINLSVKFPYLQYRQTKEQNYYKVYQSDKLSGTVMPYRNMLPDVDEDDETMYLTIWPGLGDIAYKNSLVKPIYHIPNNNLELEISVSEDLSLNDVITLVEQNTPFKIEKTRELKITGEFAIYGVDYIEFTFVSAILNDDTINTFLFVDEKDSSWVDKTRFEIHYNNYSRDTEDTNRTYIKNVSNVDATLKLQSLEDKRNIDVFQDGQLQSRSFDEGTNFIQVDVKRAANKLTALQFMIIFPRLLMIYKEQEVALGRLYEEWIPGVFEFFYPSEEEEEETGSIASRPATPSIRDSDEEGGEGSDREGDTGEQGDTGDTGEQGERAEYRTKALLKYAPEIFQSTSKSCQGTGGKRIVEPIKPEDIDTWTNTPMITSRGKTIFPQVLTYPPPHVKSDRKYYFKCPDKEYPFPGVSKNRGTNAKKFPYIPCCFKDDQIMDRQKGEKKKVTKYQQYYFGIVQEAKEDHKFTSNRILEPGREGSIPSLIQDLLSVVKSTDFRRMGVLISPNSLIHCVLTIIGEERYLRANAEEKEAIAVEERRKMAEQIVGRNLFGVLRQEFYDISNDELIKAINDTSTFFDPYNYYRIIEILYNVNLYVLLPESPYIEVPRSKYFHCRTLHQEKPTIVIYKHMGTQADRLTYAQCELIVCRNEKGQLINTFTGSLDNNETTMGSLLFQAMMYVQNVYTASIEVVPLVSESQSQISTIGSSVITSLTTPTTTDYKITLIKEPVIRTNLYSRFDFFTFLSNVNIIGQYLDSAGKMRIIVFEYQTIRYSMVVLPSQPENIPTLETIEAQDPTRLPTIDDVLALISDNPTRVTYQQETTTGLWFKVLDLDEAIYFPIKPVDSRPYFEQPLPVGQSVLEFNKGQINIVNHIDTLDLTIKILMQLAWWLYLLYQKLENPEGSVDQFLSLYTMIQPGNYVITQINRILPVVSSVEEGLRSINQQLPQVSKLYEGKYRLVLTSQRLLDGIRYFLLQSVDSTKGLDVPIPTHIEGIFNQVATFKQQPNVVIFLRTADFNNWLKQITDAGDKNVILTKLDGNLVLRTEPFVFRDEQVFLVQNVIGGSFFRALQCALIWQESYYNSGFNTEEYDDETEIPPYVVYRIDQQFKIAPIINNTGSYSEFLQILSFGQRYAALLPI